MYNQVWSGLHIKLLEGKNSVACLLRMQQWFPCTIVLGETVMWEGEHFH